MADPPSIQSPYPAPPPYWKSFTSENVKRLRQHRKDAAAIGQTGNEDDSAQETDLPLELRTLVPPQPPTDGKFNIYGITHDLQAPDPTLAEAGIEQLYPNPTSPFEPLNPQPHLQALARSMLTTFLALTGILSQNPLLQEEKTKDLQTMAFNIHDLVNKYRPHQARETLILMMEERVEKMRREVREIGEMKEKVREMLENLKVQGDKASAASGEDSKAEDKQRELFGSWNVKMNEKALLSRQRAAWDALENEMSEMASADQGD